MKLERTKNATRNIIFGVILKVYQILMPFLIRTAINYSLGDQYLGLNGLFTSVLQVLNLAELGVGSAMVFSMYKPIAQDDTKTICALMKLYRLYYRIIGLVIAVVGTILLPFIPYLIESGEKGVPAEMNIYILYIMNLAATVITYWLFAYKNSIFQAYQRVDVPSKIMLATTTLQYLLQFACIILLKNYYLFVLVLLITQALANIITAIASNKLYPQYQPEGNLSKKQIKSINQRISDLFTSKLGAVIVNSADTIVISACLGLIPLGIYQNYYFIVTAVIGVVTMIFNACTAGIGNSLITETKEKNFNDLKRFTFFISWIAGFCTCCMLNLYQPFMEIWMGTDKMLEYSAVICFCLYYYIYEINQLFTTYKDAGGVWHKDRFRPLVTALANLVMNLIMVQFWGVYGVLLSTVLSTLVIGMPWILHNLFTTMFEKKHLFSYVKSLLKYTFVVLLSCAICWLACSFIRLGLWSTLIVRGIICLILPNVIYLLAYIKKKEFSDFIRIIDKMTKHKLKLEKRLKLKYTVRNEE